MADFQFVHARTCANGTRPIGDWHLTASYYDLVLNLELYTGSLSSWKQEQIGKFSLDIIGDLYAVPRTVP
jgi:hypothetical protein